MGRSSKRTPLERLGQEDSRRDRRGQKQQSKGESAERPFAKTDMIEGHILNSY